MAVQGEVRSVPRQEMGKPGAYDGGRPISDAEIFFVCGSAEHRAFAKTREDGTFSYFTAGWLSPECSVEVRAPGYYTERFSLRDLAAHCDWGTHCHWANVSAELVPVTPKASLGETPMPAKPLRRIELTATTSKLHVFERGGQKFGLVEYVPFGAAPVAVTLPDGNHRFVASFDGRAPVESAEDTVVFGPSRVDLEYEDRRALRTWKRVAFFSALVVGPVLAGVGLEMEGAARPVLIGAGVVISVSGLLFAMDMNETKDRLRARASPDPAGSAAPSPTAVPLPER
jgi:hypothetical protein